MKAGLEHDQIKPSNEQVDAVSANAAQLAIRAGAGAGKTRVLVERYVRHVACDGARPDQILAITFTRRAAADMKTRIVARLLEQGLTEHARQAQLGPISTVHGYCERLLREYPFFAGLDPKFDVLQENQASDLLMSCSKRALAEALHAGPEERELLAKFGGRQGYRTPEHEFSGKLLQWVYEAVKSFRTAGRTPADMGTFSRNARNELDNFVFRQLQEECGEVTRDEWYAARAVRKRKIGDSRLPPFAQALPNEENEEESARLSAGLASVATRAWQYLLDSFDELRALDYNELECRACALLENNPELIQGKYEYLLVDEAQDLNPLQYRLLRATPVPHCCLVGDAQQAIYSFRGADRALFADYIGKTECKELSTNWRSDGRILRAVERVFSVRWPDFMPMTCGKRQRTTASEDPFAGEGLDWGKEIEIWQLPKTDPQAALSKGIVDYLLQSDSATNIAILMRGANSADDYIPTLKAAKVTVCSSVGHNYFLRTEIRDLSSALLALYDPSYDLAMLALLRSPMVGLNFDSVLRLGLSARGTKRPVFELLEQTNELSPEDDRALKEFFEWFTPLSQRIDRLAAWQALAEIFAATSLDARFLLMDEGRSLLANSRKLLALALERKDMGPRAFGEWLEAQQRIRTHMADAESVAPDGDTINLLTMHGAKGLEWDTVVVHAKQYKMLHKGEPHIDGQEGVISVRTAGPETIAYAAAKAKTDQENKAEDERLLYVAMTRAKRRLVLAVEDEGAQRDAWCTLIMNALAPNRRGSEWVTVRNLFAASGPAAGEENRPP